MPSNKPNLPKALVSRLFARCGYTIIPSWREERFAQTEFTRKLFSLLNIDCVIDVGANEGQFGRSLRQEVGYGGLIASFEPLPSCAEKLKAICEEDVNWVVYDCALGSEKGAARFNVMRGSQFSSFLTPDHGRVGMFKERNHIAETMDVEVMTLSDVIPAIVERYKVSNIYLKMDTQGFDIEVARGAGSLISSFRAMQFEAAVTPIYENMPRYCDAISTFCEMGFELSGMFPNNPGHFPRLIEFDCLMINRNDIPLGFM